MRYILGRLIGNMKRLAINQRVKIWKATDESSRAVDLYGVEPQNDWFEIQYYPEQIDAIIIWNRGVLLAQHIYLGKNNIECRGNVYDISKNGISRRINEIHNRLDNYGISISRFLEGSDLKDLKDFYKIGL